MSFKTCKILVVGLAALLLSHCATSNSERKDFVPTTPHTSEQIQYFQDMLQHQHFDRIAILLPASGPHQQFAQLVQDGIFYAYFQAKSKNPNLSIKFYDTSTGISITKCYQQALSDGAQFVIGPLSKEDVDEIASLSTSKIRVPTLLLNEPVRSRTLPPGLFTISLTPEYEMEFLAASLATKGLYQVALVTSQDNLGERIKKSFSTKLTTMGGEIVTQATVDNKNAKQANTVQQLLGLDLSQQRYDALQRLLKRKIVFQPRRRQDIDAIVLGTNTAQAKQVKPLFDFYYAETIPVFSHAAVYQRDAIKKQDTDLDGIHLYEIPFLLNQESKWQPARQAFYESRTGTEQSLAKLYALGMDAMLLSQKIQDLFVQNTTGISGATGILYLNDKQQIMRQLKPAVLKDGELKG